MEGQGGDSLNYRQKAEVGKVPKSCKGTNGVACGLFIPGAFSPDFTAKPPEIDAEDLELETWLKTSERRMKQMRQDRTALTVGVL